MYLPCKIRWTPNSKVGPGAVKIFTGSGAGAAPKMPRLRNPEFENHS